MKTRFTLLTFMLSAFFFTKAQQIPNGTFGSWTTYAPVGWTTYEQISSGVLSGFTFEDMTDVVSGDTASVKLVSDSVSIEPSRGVIAGVLSLGTGTPTGFTTPPAYTGIAFAYRPDTLVFDFQYTSPTNDSAIVLIQMTKNHIDTVAFGSKVLDTTSSWTQMSVVLTGAYWDNSIPDTLLIQFYSSYGTNTTAVKGSTLHLDNVRFGYVNPPNAINEVKAQSPVKVYPNPASDILNIVSAADISGSNMEIFDITGRLVLSSQLESSFNKVNIGNLANGNYIYKISNTKNEVIDQNKFAVIK